MGEKSKPFSFVTGGFNSNYLQNLISLPDFLLLPLFILLLIGTGTPKVDRPIACPELPPREWRRNLVMVSQSKVSGIRVVHIHLFF
jgi:hypothetical protein